MLPWNVIVQEKENGVIEIAAVNPLASMQAVINKDLMSIANEVGDRLKKLLRISINT